MPLWEVVNGKMLTRHLIEIIIRQDRVFYRVSSAYCVIIGQYSSLPLFASASVEGVGTVSVN